MNSLVRQWTRQRYSCLVITAVLCFISNADADYKLVVKSRIQPISQAANDRKVEGSEGADDPEFRGAVIAYEQAEFDLSWYTMDGGGATFTTGGTFTLGGTIGQHDAGTLSGGTFTIAGGFWGFLTATACTCQLYGDIAPTGGDCNVDVGDVLAVLDGFAGIVPWDALADISPCGGDGNVDVGDVLAVLDSFAAAYACPHPCPP